MNLGNLTILDCDSVGLLLKDVTNSRVGGCLIRDDRPKTESHSIKASGGKGNMIVGNALGRPHEIAKGEGMVEGNYDAK